MKPVIYVNKQIMRASTKCVNALDYIDDAKRITKSEMREHLRGIYSELRLALDVPTKYNTPDMQTDEERNQLPNI